MSSNIRISDKAVSRLETPATGRAFHWDSSLVGFGLAVTPTGSKSYVYQYRTPQGRTRRLTIGRTDKLSASAARKEAGRAQTRVRNGGDPVEDRREQRKSLTLKALIDEYVEELPSLRTKRTRTPLKPRTIDCYRTSLHGGYLPASLLRTDITTITAGQARAAMPVVARRASNNPRSKANGETMANLVWRCLSRVFSWAVETGRLDANPLQGAGGVSYADRKKERFLSRDEAGRLAGVLTAWEERQPMAVAIVRLLMLTGCRRSEIERLRWSEVNEEAARLEIEDTKTGARFIHVSAEALAVIEGAQTWRIVGNPYVFPATNGGRHRRTDEEGSAKNGTRYQGIGKVWRAMRADAGLDDLRLHDLRHSYASFALWQGIPLAVVGRLLGHRSAQTTARYGHIADDVAATAASDVGAVLGGLMAAAPAADPAGKVAKLNAKTNG